MTMHPFNLSAAHSSWRSSIETALKTMDSAYLNMLTQHTAWLPGPEKIFSAFSLPMKQVNFVLFGESPYPRRESANGYAFWDAAVKHLWSETGLDKRVNRATSLRNIIKMLLIASDKLNVHHTSQPDIADIEKSLLVQTNEEFFQNLLSHGFLLLNASLVLRDDSPQKEARAWAPFLKTILHALLQTRPQVKFILLGRIANELNNLIPENGVDRLYAEHPYNLSFVTNPAILSFFKPLNLLKKTST